MVEAGGHAAPETPWATTRGPTVDRSKPILRDHSTTSPSAPATGEEVAPKPR
jgi:hypothetical protein